jgi:hypothetical protein
MDQHILQYFFEKYKSDPKNWIRGQYYGIGKGCPVCHNIQDEDVEYFTDYFFPLIKETPMFMNSNNLD